MKPSPPDWPRISVSIVYQEPVAALDWLCRAFGFELRLRIDDEAGGLIHSELEYGEGLIMVMGERPFHNKPERDFARSPRSLGGKNTASFMVYVDDIEAHCAQAREAGAVILTEPETSDYGEDYWADRGYSCEDLEGHTWYFAQRLRTRGR